MTRPRFNLRQVMVTAGAVGALLGLLLRSPGVVVPLLPLAGVAAVAAAVGFGLRELARWPRWVRLVFEFATLLGLLAWSAWLWRPPFYIGQANRCDELARRALSAADRNSDAAPALRREAAWFARRASALRRRGLWLGLRLGPWTRDESSIGEWDTVVQLGIVEAIERHEKSAIGLR